MDLSKAQATQWHLKAKRAEDDRAMSGSNALERGPVEVVVVVVADEQDVNRWQILKADAGSAVALGPGELHGAGAARPDRVGEDIEAAGLQQNRGVIDEGRAEFGAVNTRGRRRAGVGVDPAAPRADFTITHPFEGGAETVFGDARIEETPIAEVFDGGRRRDEDVRAVIHEFLFIRMQRGGEGRNFPLAGEEKIMECPAGLRCGEFGL